MNSSFKYMKSLMLRLFFLSFSFSGCKKLTELPIPIDRIGEDNVYTNNETAAAVLTGIYTTMVSPSDIFTGHNSISLFGGLSADEFSLHNDVTNDVLIKYYMNLLSIDPARGSEFWPSLYGYIRKCNAALEGLTASQTLSNNVKEQLIGEAKFLRAFFYFYLINFFGDAPLVLSTDYKINMLLPKNPKAQVYSQIISDLTDAQQLLNANYLDGSLQPYSGIKQRVRPNKWVATALLARVYLYNDDYSNAEVQASAIINQSELFKLTSLNIAFLKNSTEAIWQLQPTQSGFNTSDAPTFIVPSSGPSDSYPVQLSSQLLISFEPGDQRRFNKTWIDSIEISGITYYYPYKYKIYKQNSNISSTTGTTNMNEYLMVLRLAEQYLIRAEARVLQNNIAGAQSDLNSIRNRAGLQNTLVNEKNALLSEILHERQVELFTEWGHRWLDLKRTDNIDSIMEKVTPLKANGNMWRSYQQVYPIPMGDIQKNKNLVQNPGY